MGREYWLKRYVQLQRQTPLPVESLQRCYLSLLLFPTKTAKITKTAK